MQGGEFQASPPVNNLLQPDIFNKLDAQVRERTRVVNTQLDQRLLAQQNILTKYRTASERFHRRERNVVVQELNRICTRLPAVSRIPDFRNKFLYGDEIHDDDNHQDHHHHHHHYGGHGSFREERLHHGGGGSLPDVRGAQKKKKKIRGIPEERPEMPFCQRFFLHHLPTKKKYYRTSTPSPSPPFHPAHGGREGDGEDKTKAGVVLPPLDTGNELSTTTVEKQELSETGLPPIEQNQKKAVSDRTPATAENVDPLAGSISHRVDLASSPPQSDSGLGEELALMNAGHSDRFSDDGDDHQPHSERTRDVLPPLARQNVRLAHSSPQLFHG